MRNKIIKLYKAGRISFEEINKLIKNQEKKKDERQS